MFYIIVAHSSDRYQRSRSTISGKIQRCDRPWFQKYSNVGTVKSICCDRLLVEDRGRSQIVPDTADFI
ncbi:hypothetical protein [Calothrix sp. NIES-2100]|uniref:hypothetical protein n=1 Tax=Calothrix sp. NIES-2100 TaxID=1954172 RepID=UPI0030D93473